MPVIYEFVQGIRVHQSWTDRESVPVPPQHLRERLRFPARYALATLAPEVEDTYPPVLYKGAREYLKNWPHYVQRGMGPIFAGNPGTGTSWTAAALANEIVLRSQDIKDISASWLSTFWMLRMILDYRDMKHSEGYTNLRNTMMKTELVIVDDLLSARTVEGGVPFMHFIYGYRYDHGLPIITTISSGIEFWPELKNLFGKTFTERLRATSENLVFKI